MQKVDTDELRRLWHKSEDPSVVGLDWANARHAMHDEFLALLDELEAARAELEALKVPLAIYERHTKLIGAAEWLEEFAGDADGSIHITHAWLRERAAKLRQEAEDATR